LSAPITGKNTTPARIPTCPARTSPIFDGNKSSVRVLVWHHRYNDLDIRDFIEKRREAFASVARLPPYTKDRSSVPLWTTSAGWGDADVDWSSTAKTIAEHKSFGLEKLAQLGGGAGRGLFSGRHWNPPILLGAA
jgi:hypothetical protein